jgi:hypothetical protein
MDINELMSTMLSKDTVKGLGKLTGTSQKGVRGVLSSALPSMLNGAKAQADDSDTASGFVKALSDHAKDDTNDIGAFISGIDLNDGGKIIGHLLGNSAQATAQKAAESAGVKATKANNILSAAAPLLMSLIGQQVSSGSNASSNNASGISGLMGSLLSNTDIGSLIGGLAGGSKPGLLGSIMGLFGKK